MINIEKLDNSIKSVTISSGKGNLISIDDINSLLETVHSTQFDNSVGGLLIRGDNRCFSTGLNVAEVKLDERSDFFALFDSLLVALFSYPKPVVVVVDGHSIGGGLLLQCCADYVVAADNEKIKLGLPELKIGLTIDELMTSLLKFNTGNIRVLQELLYNGDYIGVRRSKEIGFIDCIVEPELVMEAAIRELTNLINYKSKAFCVTKLRLRAHTIQRMNNALNAKCYIIFNELN